MKNIIQQDNFFLTNACHIDEICSPLKKLDITYFTYMKNHIDGSQVYLSNSAYWIEDYYKLELYKSSSFEAGPDLYCSGNYIWTKEDNAEVYLHGRNKFDSDNGMTIINKSDLYCEFYFFSGSTKATWLSNFYLNNMDLLEKFIIYFKDSANLLLKKAEKNRIFFPKLSNNADLIPESMNYIYDNVLNVRNEFLREMNFHTNISARENEVAFHLLKGKTAIETAKALFISKKTVERHIENMKVKLQCGNKVELIKRLLMLSSSHYKILHELGKLSIYQRFKY